MAMSASASTDASAGTGMDMGGSAGESTLHGGACSVSHGSTNGAPWIGLGLLLALRRRRQSASRIVK